MTRKERDEVMRYVGQLEGIVSIISPIDDDDVDSMILIQKLKEISEDLEAVVKGYDRFDISDLKVLEISKPQEGGDDDDV